MNALFTHWTPDQTADKPAFLVARDPDTTDWWFDHDSTRYHAVTVEIGDRILVAVEPDERLGCSWFVFENNRDELDWYYVAEKLRLRDGDAPGWAILLGRAMYREIVGLPAGVLRMVDPE